MERAESAKIVEPLIDILAFPRVIFSDAFSVLLPAPYCR